jgi:hypothetical protein
MNIGHAIQYTSLSSRKDVWDRRRHCDQPEQCPNDGPDGPQQVPLIRNSTGRSDYASGW